VYTYIKKSQELEKEYFLFLARFGTNGFEKYKKRKLVFTTNLGRAISDVEIVFIAVGTPMGADASADLQYLLAVTKSTVQSM
jgi:UDP-glucose 6-dehydrogenase